MKYLILNNGIKIPQIGLGIYDLHEEKAILDAIDMGYRLFDTAQMYGNERLLGNAIKKSNVPREEFFITTKLYYTSKKIASFFLAILYYFFINFYLLIHNLILI